MLMTQPTLLTWNAGKKSSAHLSSFEERSFEERIKKGDWYTRQYWVSEDSEGLFENKDSLISAHRKIIAMTHHAFRTKHKNFIFINL